MLEGNVVGVGSAKGGFYFCGGCADLDQLAISFQRLIEWWMQGTIQEPYRSLTLVM